MRSFLISDNEDTLIGMRLAGIKGVMVKGKEDVISELNKALEDNEIKIIIVTQKVLSLAEKEIIELKIKRDYPLIISIPDRHGANEADYITRHIRESIGLKI